jgi:hypothetical protein
MPDWTSRAREIADGWDCLEQPSSILVDAIAALAAEAYREGRREALEHSDAGERWNDGYAAGVAEERARWTTYHGTEQCVCEACAAALRARQE